MVTAPTDRAERRTLTPPLLPLRDDYERIPLRLLGGKTSVVVELPSQMTEKAWTQMIDMLNALKPGYVEEEG